MDKKTLRNELIKTRNNLDIDLVIKKSEKITKQIFMLPEFEEADEVLLYADFRHEVMTKDIFDECIRKKKRVFFPKCEGDDLIFYQIVSVGELADGAYGVKEPKGNTLKYIYREKINTLAIIPGVGFDINGSRIGFGKGYYDRFLKDKIYINKVGLCFSEQLLENIPCDLHDCKMDKVVTEELVYSFLRI